MTNSLIENIFLHSRTESRKFFFGRYPIGLVTNSFSMFGSENYVKRRLTAISPTLWATDRVVTHERVIYKPNFTTERCECLLRVFLSFDRFCRAIRSLLPVMSRVGDKNHFRNVVGGTVKGDRDKRSSLSAIWVEGKRLFWEKFSGKQNLCRFDPAETKNKKSSFMISFQCEGCEQDHRYANRAALNHLRVNKIPAFWPKITTWVPRLIIIFRGVKVCWWKHRRWRWLCVVVEWTWRLKN